MGREPRNAGLARILAWFTSREWSPLPFQHEVWQAYEAGQNGLIHAATGTGRTYAAWLGPLIEWMNGDGEVNPPLRVLWITPLRALVADTENALRVPLEDLNIPWRLQARSGDTKASIGARQRKSLPAISRDRPSGRPHVQWIPRPEQERAATASI